MGHLTQTKRRFQPFTFLTTAHSYHPCRTDNEVIPPFKKITFLSYQRRISSWLYVLYYCISTTVCYYDEKFQELFMGVDSFTEITSESWFSRIGSSLKGILFGLLLFVVSFFLLFWNEGRTVERMQTLNEGSGAVISIDASVIDPANQDKLVHISAFLTTEESLKDNTFQVEVQALKLYRDVEMYQWVESSESKSETAVGGEKTTTTVYTYAKSWRGTHQNSDTFKQPEEHINPHTMPFSDNHMTTDKATAGAFSISEAMVSGLHKLSDYTLDSSKPLPTLEAQSIHHFNGGYYLGESSATPVIGDMKVSYRVLKPQDVSIVAQQQGHTLSSYITQAGGTINLMVSGTHSAVNMFKQAHKDNNFMKWALRLAGFLMMVIGLSMIFMPLSVIADVVPFIGSIVGGGVVLFAVLISAVLSLITVSLAWIFYRPLLGILMLAVAGGILWLIKIKFKSNPAS